MRLAVSVVFAFGLLTAWSPARAAPSPSCTERFQAAGVDPDRLSPGERGKLDGYDFIVATNDVAAKICARVDAEKGQADGLRSQLNAANEQLAKAQDEVAELKGGGPLKDDYLVVEGGLLAWAVIATIWASYFAGRLNPRHHPY